MKLFDFYSRFIDALTTLGFENASVYLSYLAVVFIGFFAGCIIDTVICYLPVWLKARWEKALLSARDHCVTNANCSLSSLWSLFCERVRSLFCRSNPLGSSHVVACLCAAITLLMYQRQQPDFATLAGLLLSYLLITLIFIDLNELLLPDEVTLPLLWLGLIINLDGLFTDLHSAVIGAIAGYLSLWLLYWAVKLVAQREGMGYGDFKLLAGIGAWFGWQYLHLITLIGSLLGLILTAIIYLSNDKQIVNRPMPLGSYLSIAALILLLCPELRQ